MTYRLYLAATLFTCCAILHCSTEVPWPPAGNTAAQPPAEDTTAQPVQGDPAVDAGAQPVQGDPAVDAGAQPVQGDPAVDAGAQPVQGDPAVDAGAQPVQGDPAVDAGAQPVQGDPAVDAGAQPVQGDPAVGVPGFPAPVAQTEGSSGTPENQTFNFVNQNQFEEAPNAGAVPMLDNLPPLPVIPNTEANTGPILSPSLPKMSTDTSLNVDSLANMGTETGPIVDNLPNRNTITDPNVNSPPSVGTEDGPNVDSLPDMGSNTGPNVDVDSIPVMGTDHGPPTLPGFRVNAVPSNGQPDLETNATAVGTSGEGQNFDFSANKGDSTDEGEPGTAPVLNRPLPMLPWQQNNSPENDAGFNVTLTLEDACGGDLCAGLEMACGQNEKCVMTGTCETVCTKDNGSVPVLDDQPENDHNLRPLPERQCNISGHVCIHGMCLDGSSCICDKGYKGHLCADKECHLPCGRGVCVMVSDKHFRCDCYPGAGGPSCTEPECTLQCVHGTCRYKPGLAKITVDSPMYCNCPSDWTGNLCADRKPDPAASSKRMALAVGVSVPVVCLVAVAISWYILWRKRVLFVFRVINMFKAYEDDDDKLYDAYVSLIDSDYGFLRNVLQPKMEEMGHRLFLQARDAKAGDVKSEMILEAVEKSRRCILLLSSDYISNEWCRFEYLIAQHETCVKLKQRIIPILLDDIDKDKKMDKTLRFIVDSVKCLRYPRPPPEVRGTQLNTSDPESGQPKSKEQLKFEKQEAKFWARFHLNMPKKRAQQDVKSPSLSCITGAPLSCTSTTPLSGNNSSKNKCRTFFNNVAKYFTFGHSEKSSPRHLSNISPVVSDGKAEKNSSVTLVSAKSLADPKSNTFYTSFIDKDVSSNSSEVMSAVYGDDTKVKHLNSVTLETLTLDLVSQR